MNLYMQITLVEKNVRHANSNFCKIQKKTVKVSGTQANVDFMLSQCLTFSRGMISRKQYFKFIFITTDLQSQPEQNQILKVKKTRKPVNIFIPILTHSNVNKV